MSDCCCPAPRPEAERLCPACATSGATVNELTIKALLTEAAMNRFEQSAYRFCPAPSCAVVYFDEHGRVFNTADIRVPIWQKQSSGDRVVCYCFGENERAIREEIERQGRSEAVERVRAHIAAKRCACDIRNPRGACCLGDVIAAVKRVSTQVEDRATR